MTMNWENLKKMICPYCDIFTSILAHHLFFRIQKLSEERLKRKVEEAGGIKS